MKRTILILSILAALTVGVVAPSVGGRALAATATAPVASATQTHPALLDKTRFLAHAGIAFFIIHHEYGRYKQGYFKAGTSGRVKHLAVAALALAIGVHEAKVAYGIAETSHSKTLHALASPFASLATTMDGIRAKFAKGQGSDADIAQLNTAASSINSTASGSDVGSIKDVSTPLPSAA